MPLNENITPSKWKLRFGAVLSLAIVATIGSTYFDHSSSPSRQLTSTSSSNYIEKIIASNEYGESVSGSEYPWLSGRLVVEPHKQTTLEIITTEDAHSSFTYQWRIIDSSNGNEFNAQGIKLVTSFGKIGKHVISVNVMTKKGVFLNTFNVDVSCLYVKRELRTLTVEDRENFLNAMYEMWKLGTMKGREKYGEEFTGIDRFVYIHTREATGDINCDKWHEGTGFLTHHLALTTSFDLSLRAIDKRVSIPYWDFTIEGEKLYKAGLGPKSLSTITPILTDTYFGEVDQLDHVKTSRWARTKAIKSLEGRSIHTSYGFVRAPWNNVPDQEMVRHVSDVCGLEPVNKPVPACASHYNVLAGESLPDILLSIAGAGHGPLHVNFGGVGGECTGAMNQFYTKHAKLLSEKVSLASVKDKILAETGEDKGWISTDEFTLEAMVQKYVHLEYFHVYRSLYRSQTCALDGMAGGLQCPESCGLDTPQSECTCTCKGIDTDGTVTDAFDWKNFEPCLYGSGTSKTLLQTTLSESVRKELVTTMCTSGVKEGEMLESASPLDPLFWMIHPVLDRLHVAKRLSAVSDIEYGNYGKINGFISEEWLEYSAYSTDEKVCEGHGMYDAVLQDLSMPSSMISNFDANGDGELNNIEYYDAIDPTNEDGIDYIYDHFTWNHCDSTASTVLAEGQLFVNDVEPSKWDGVLFKDLRNDNTNKHQITKSLQEHRDEVSQGLKPGKILKKTDYTFETSEDVQTLFQLIEE
jgi:hypothetical protein